MNHYSSFGTTATLTFFIRHRFRSLLRRHYCCLLALNSWQFWLFCQTGRKMAYKNTIVATAMILLLLLFSGCIGEKKTAQAPESLQKDAANVSSPNLIQTLKEENTPEISIASFTSIYTHDNSGNKSWASYNVSEGYCWLAAQARFRPRNGI